MKFSYAIELSGSISLAGDVVEKKAIDTVLIKSQQKTCL